MEYQALLVRLEPFLMHSGLLGAELKKIAGEDECLHCTLYLVHSAPTVTAKSAAAICPYPPASSITTSRNTKTQTEKLK